jgi:2-polyprenyl-3-methyl-5-hydroxy-6-metoxy-1,4-benzoquinol methylase
MERLEMTSSSIEEIETHSPSSVKLKRLLLAIHLYRPARFLYTRRPDVRMKLWNAGYRLAGAYDHLPIPPTRLIELVTASPEIGWFLQSGRMAADSMKYALRRNKLYLEDFKAILDFGCGCGRVIRWLSSLNGPRIYGVDYNQDLIKWCQRHLGNYGEFQTNYLLPPVDFPENKFDLIYALSVLTHLTEEYQRSWMNEFARLLSPGGILILTLHGKSRINILDQADQLRFLAGELVVTREKMAGTNECAAYHPEAYVHKSLSHGFEILDFIEIGARDSCQDIYLLRKTTNRNLL